MAQRKRLGDVLQESGLISEEQITEALQMQRSSGEKLGEALVKLGFVTNEQIADALSEHLRIPRVDFSRRYITAEIVNLVPEDMVLSHYVLPLEVIDDTLVTAMADPLNIVAIDALQRRTGHSIQPMVATVQEILDAYRRTSDITATARKVFAEFATDDQEEESEQEQFLGDAPGVRLANMILTRAVTQRASDVHLEPREGHMNVRYRIDGILQEMMTVPKNLRDGVSSRIKIMADMDITERRRAQDGRIQFKAEDRQVDMRISTLPTVYGEKIVARVLDKGETLLQIGDFGFADDSVERIYTMLRHSQGMVLVTGPTGSGKTTTLYGFLNHLNSPERNIISIEDPVEFHIDGVNQVQTNAKVGLTFASGLRTVLRQDPDVIMVGEIRDGETAEIAVRSALTGHVVLSTLHTNSAVATIARLLDMGVEPYLLGSTLIGVIAQRLVRTICTDCKEPVALTDPVIIAFVKTSRFPVPDTVYRGRGCPLCNGRGYRGRAAVEEVLMVNTRLRRAIEERESQEVLLELARKSGTVSIKDNAIGKLIAGMTTAEEVLRTVYSAEDTEEEQSDG